MSEEEENIGDVFQPLQPVLAGEKPEEGKAYKVWGDITFTPVESHRNLWVMHVDGVNMVTFDADAFPSTADLGRYVKGIVDDLEDLNGDGSETDPRQIGTGAFQ